MLSALKEREYLSALFQMNFRSEARFQRSEIRGQNIGIERQSLK